MTQHQPVRVMGGNRGKGTTLENYLDKEEHPFGVTPPENRKAAYTAFVSYHHALNSFVHHLLHTHNEQPTVIGLRDLEPAYLEDLGSSLLPEHLRGKAESRQVPAELREALQELQEVTADAEDDGLEIPSDLAFKNAERSLRAMYRISPRRYGVYPVSGGRIAIDARGPNGRIAVLTCESDGGALCLVTIDGEYRRARYSTARELPDGFVREALAALDA